MTSKNGTRKQSSNSPTPSVASFNAATHHLQKLTAAYNAAIRKRQAGRTDEPRSSVSSGRPSGRTAT